MKQIIDIIKGLILIYVIGFLLTFIAVAGIGLYNDIPLPEAMETASINALGWPVMLPMMAIFALAAIANGY